MKRLFVIFLFLTTLSAQAQLDKGGAFITEDGGLPHFPGGEEGLKKFISENLKWPAPEWCGSGTVYVKFKVDSLGNVCESSIKKGIDSLANNEALRVVRIMPKLIPAKINGRCIASWYILPIKFTLH